MAKHRKRRCRLARIGGAPHVPGVDHGGLARHFAAPPLVPKKGKQKNRTVAGGHRPAGRTGRNRPDTSQVIHAGPSLALPCGHTDGSSAATSTSGRGAGNGVFLPFPARQECRSSSSLHPGAWIRRGNGNGPSPRACRGADQSRAGRLDAGPSDPFGNARRDRPGFQIGTVFLERRIASPGGNLLLTRIDQGNNGPT